MQTKTKSNKKRKSALEAKTFSPYYVKKELKAVRWAKWKTQGTNIGIGRNLSDSLIFCVFFALCSVGFTAIISAITRLF